MSLELHEEIDIKSEPFEEHDTEVDGNETVGQNTTLSGNEMDADNIEIGVEDVKIFEIVEVKTEPVTDNSLTCGKCNEQAFQLHKINFHDKDIKCSICNATFTKQSSLNSHLLTHADKKPFFCPLCSSKFTRRNHLRTHLLKRHNLDGISVESLLQAINIKTHKCELCHLTFVTKKDVSVHINSLHIESTSRPFKCIVCEACFITKTHLNSHLTIHTGEKPYKCSICSRDFRLKHFLQRHLIRKHKIVATADFVQKQPTVPVIIDQNLYTVCKKCNVRFSSHENLSQHECTIQDNVKIEPFEEHDTEFDSNETFGQNTTLSGNEMDTDNIEIGVEDVKPFEIVEVKTETLLAEPVTDNSLTCGKCIETFTSHSSLDDHLLTHLPSSNFRKETLYFCKNCDNKYYETKQGLEQHLQYFHKGLKPHICNVCHQSFTTRGIMKQHFYTLHSEEGPFKCGVCSKDYRLKVDLKKHIIRAHTSVVRKQKKFACEICNKEFKFHHILNQHIQNVHQNIVKQLKCNICDSSFTEKASLDLHLTKHEKQYKCSKCENIFIGKIVLITHLIKVHDLTENEIKHELSECIPITINCEICKMGFKSSGYLQLHIQTVHQNPSTRKKTIACEICNKEYKSSVHLNKHIQSVHKNPISCNDCGTCFKKNSKLDIHLKRQSCKNWYFKCLICFKGYRSKPQLIEHLNKEHELKETRTILKNEIDVKDVIACEICKEEFKNSGNFKRHSLYFHQDLQIFKITICDGCFILKSSINVN